MLLVAIVGNRGSGKTTFLGLLYATLVSSGSDKGDDLRFRVAYDSLDEITALFQRLMSGGFPDSVTKEGIHGLNLELGVPPSGRGVLSRLGSRKWTPDQARTIRFSLPGSLDEPTSGLHQGSTFGTGRWRDALDADVAVVLADSTKLAAKNEDSKAGPMEAYDRRVESLFIAIQRWRSSGGRGVLHPVFVLSKFDSMDPEVLRVANLEPKPPAVGRTGPRATYARALLEPNLPRTLAMVQTTVGKKLRFEPPTFVFSGVHRQAKGSDRPERIKLRRTTGGGWEPDYFQDEYLGFLEELGRVAAATKD